MHVEEISPGQWDRLRELRLRALRESSEWFAARVEVEELKSESEWRALCSEESWRTFVENGRDIALMGVSVAEPIRGCDCWLFSCWIEPEYRGKGIMDLMIKELDAISREKGWSKQGLGVWPNNERAIRAYERLGFYKDGEPLQSRSRPGQLYQPMFRHLPNSN